MLVLTQAYGFPFGDTFDESATRNLLVWLPTGRRLRITIDPTSARMFVAAKPPSVGDNPLPSVACETPTDQRNFRPVSRSEYSHSWAPIVGAFTYSAIIAGAGYPVLSRSPSGP
jgi:hypothetical protein